MSDDDDIGSWLAGLGLDAYTSAFEENDIDLTVLPDLTKDDLIEIGVTSVGHRRKLLAAAGLLGGKAMQMTVAQEPSSAERRIVTVMFCDLVDSVGLSAISDAEDFREFIAQFRHDVETAIQPFGGTISQFLGDGVMASFGYPRASGHDAERAVAAGLAVIEKVQRIAPFAGRQAEVRVGIATGLSVVGSFDGDVSLRDDSAIGDTPNLASRLQGLAEPNTMLIAQQTRDLVGEIFECTALDETLVKGFKEPIQLWKVNGRGNTLSRFEALRTKRRARRFVGRIEEQAFVAERIKDMRAGRGKLLLIEAETGIGKSRLVQHMLSETTPAVTEPLVLQCSPYSTAMQFFSVRYFVAEAIGLLDQDSMGQIQDWLYGHGITDDKAFGLIVNLIALDDEKPPELEQYTSEQIRAMTLDLMINLIEREALAAGALVIEDMQWIDPTTMELLERLIPRLTEADCLTIATSHPSRDADWFAVLDPEVLKLGRIPAEDLRDLVREIAGNVFLNDNVVDTITERSDGVPIFAEELAIGYLEAKAADDVFVSGLGQVPLSLTESLLARVDRLVNGKRIASTAAAIGRQFPVSVLVAVSDLPSSVVHTGISELLEAGVFEPGVSLFGEAIRFRHGLVCDAAYELLLRKQRTVIHGHIAQTACDSFPAITENRPSIVAYHWDKAGEPLKAIELWMRAGYLANSRSAHSEALDYLEKAEEANAKMEHSIERDERALDLSLSIITQRICLRGFQEADISETEALAELSKRVDRSEKLIPALTLSWVHLITSDQARPALDFAYQVREAETATNDAERLIVLRMCATAHLFCGELDNALREYHAFMALYDPEIHAEAMRAGHSDHAAMVMMGLAETYTLKGDRRQAVSWGQKSMELPRLSNRQHDYAHTVTFSGCLHPYLARDYETMVTYARELRGLLDENPLANWDGFPDLFLGLACIHDGDLEEGLELAEHGALSLLESKRYGNWWQVLFAEACVIAKQWEKASDMLDKAQASMAQSELRFGPEYFRIRAQVMREYHGDAAASDAALREGLAMATKQGSKLFEERILADMAKHGLLYA
jgi:class 3 adenylate cyclase